MTLATVLEKRETKSEALDRQAYEAYQQFKVDGLHNTAVEIDSWLATWGTAHETAAPRSHK